ncbi:hypothetical protein BKA80DRAFT_271844 [Phyllosticta citrichinensis]
MASRAVKSSSWRTSRWLPKFLRKPEPERPYYNIYKNPYRAKRLWPPDLSKLSWRDQVHFDRKYRRRLKMVSTWPVWNRRVKLAQWLILGSKKHARVGEDPGIDVGQVSVSTWCASLIGRRRWRSRRAAQSLAGLLSKS